MELILRAILDMYGFPPVLKMLHDICVGQGDLGEQLDETNRLMWNDRADAIGNIIPKFQIVMDDGEYEGGSRGS
jgi:hypothetical protein